MQESFRRIMALIYKEFVAMWMDVGTRKILILPIIVQSIIFGYGATFNLIHIPYIVYDESRSEQSTNIINAINHNSYFSLVQYCNSKECVDENINNAKALLCIYFQSDFLNTKEIGIIADARNTASANTAIAYLNSIFTELNNQDNKPAINISYRYLYNENNITRFGILTGMILALSMIQVMLLSSLAIAKEREEGTFDMMLMTPTTPIEILLGKAIPPTLIAILQGVILFFICTLYFKIPFQGNFLLLLFAISLYSISCVGVGLTISAMAHTTQQAVVFSFLIIMPCIILSGLLTPIEAMPQWFIYITYLNPLFYGIAAVQRIYLEGASFFYIWHLFIPLIITACITLPMATILFRRELN